MTQRGRRTIGAAGVAAFCMLVGTACGDNGASSGSGGTGTGVLGTGASASTATGGSTGDSTGATMDRAALVSTPLEACVYYLEGWCERAARCDLFDAFGSCMETLAGRCPDMFFSEGSQRTVENMVSCGDTWRSHACGDVGTPDCTVYGTLPFDSACLHGSQCTTGLCSSSFIDCGTCIERTPLGEGCANNVCVRGGVCVGGTCIDAASAEPLPAVGEACSAGLCDATSYCDGYGTAGDICVALPATGLEFGAVCAASTGVPCADGLLCDGDIGTCQPAGRIFEACDEGAGLGCHGSAECVNGTCAPVDASGLYATVCPG